MQAAGRAVTGLLGALFLTQSSLATMLGVPMTTSTAPSERETAAPPAGDDPAAAVGPERALRERGLRVTAARVAMLETLHRHPHADVESLTAATRERLGTLSKQAGYDILDAFVRTGLARRIQPAGSPARFEARVGDNHHHVVCRRCGAAADVDCTVGEAPCLEPSHTSGFTIDEAEVTFWGWCPDCQTADDEQSPTAPTEE